MFSANFAHRGFRPTTIVILRNCQHRSEGASDFKMIIALNPPKYSKQQKVVFESLNLE